MTLISGYSEDDAMRRKNGGWLLLDEVLHERTRRVGVIRLINRVEKKLGVLIVRDDGIIEEVEAPFGEWRRLVS